MTTIVDVPAPTEAECQATIVATCRHTGWRVLAIRPALNRRGKWGTPIQGDPGYPDLTLCHPLARRILFVELKRKPNRLEPAQELWRNALVSAGAEWRLVYVPDELDTFCQQLADTAVSAAAAVSAVGAAAAGTRSRP